MTDEPAGEQRRAAMAAGRVPRLRDESHPITSLSSKAATYRAARGRVGGEPERSGANGVLRPRKRERHRVVVPGAARA
jgi:hypothetical protein